MKKLIDKSKDALAVITVISILFNYTSTFSFMEEVKQFMNDNVIGMLGLFSLAFIIYNKLLTAQLKRVTANQNKIIQTLSHIIKVNEQAKETGKDMIILSHQSNRDFLNNYINDFENSLMHEMNKIPLINIKLKTSRYDLSETRELVNSVFKDRTTFVSDTEGVISKNVSELVVESKRNMFIKTGNNYI